MCKLSGQKNGQRTFETGFKLEALDGKICTNSSVCPIA